MKLLEQLTTTPSVPGREDRIRQVITKRIKGLVDEVKTDVMGSLIAVRRPRPTKKNTSKKPPIKIMLAAHMDQIGFLVSYIDDNGFLRVNPVGGFDPRNLFSRPVKVCTSSGDLPGVMNPAGKPIHMSTEEERKKIPEVGEFFVDVGLTAAKARRKIKLGDMVVYDAPFQRIGNTVVAPALDNRIGCWAQIRVLEKLKNHNCEIYATWTVQEEVGLRGAGPAAFGIEPDLALSCDTTLCCQTPGVAPEQHVSQFGDGVCLKIMDSSTITDVKMVEDIERIAKRKKIKCQRGILPRGGQDGAAIQRSRMGVRVAVFACPVKYIHTATEMAAVSDIESYRDLLIAYLGQL